MSKEKPSSFRRPLEGTITLKQEECTFNESIRILDFTQGDNIVGQSTSGWISKPGGDSS